jgi:hypothetical protein
VIGLSNYTVKHLSEFVRDVDDTASVLPAVLFFVIYMYICIYIYIYIYIFKHTLTYVDSVNVMQYQPD